ncbi:prolyl oligopeptidase family serine peptidase [Parachitinimonas caeni]|uniref:Prolyl oligopeptidase family serine peptidase n=1 Tax=Parachitinimonas caeni TaxID=3031301 RepID=A0ABT7DS07_9NEIS|nr:prolyl oligopeptidase family serine peptidase [Parachitinimonas caeni]MDK2122852.1 prolyl oligopeptidase family serine peptidase [Parachitinimonas caeni]
MKNLIATAALLAGTALAAPGDDPYLWMEEIEGQKPLDWVKTHNRKTLNQLETDPAFGKLQKSLLSVYDSPARIPSVQKLGKFFYNFWQDAAHPKGVWRRTSLAEYRKDKPKWEAVLDLDALAKSEGENWVWHGFNCREPENDRCLISLSRGGSDAAVVREFDLASKSFVKDGFALPEAKSDTTWIDRDTLYIGTDFGKGSMTDSGYPRIIKRWKRGTPLTAAETVLEGQASDVSVSAAHHFSRGQHYLTLHRAVTFWESEEFLVTQGKQVKIEKPKDAQISFIGNQLILNVKSDYKAADRTYPAGSVLVIDFARYQAGERRFTALFEPTERTSLGGMTATRKHVLIEVLDNVKSRLYEWRLEKDQWWRRSVETPAFGNLEVHAVDTEASDDYLLTFSDFLTPTTLYLAQAGQDKREKLKQLPAFFDASPYEVAQYESTSKDGTRVPYFVIARKGIKLDGNNPTLLYGYGGFRVPQTPFYSATVGQAWLEKGGVYVLGNIRGGGEFGPRWHEAALKEKRQTAYNDFISIAEDLHKRGVSSPKKLGIMGGSNGGLLMGVMLTQRPDLFGAVVCQVPLLDMRRYHTLLAGASWMGEFGNPDKPEEWAYISKYSPYHNLKQDVKYPPTLFATSTKDDRVHPGHARKMAAKMLEMGQPVSYFENIEGGHGGAADNAQRALMNGVAYTYLWHQLNK